MTSFDIDLIQILCDNDGMIAFDYLDQLLIDYQSMIQ